MAKFTLGIRHPYSFLYWEASKNDGASWVHAYDTFGDRCLRYTAPELEIPDNVLTPDDSCLVRVTAQNIYGDTIQSQARLTVTSQTVSIEPAELVLSGGGPSIAPALLELKAS